LRHRGYAERRGALSDTYAYKDLKLPFTYSCYLVKHGEEYMVWDTGFAVGANPNAPKVSLVDQLAQLKVTPEQVKYVGVSHYHGDHTGQAASFPKSTLLIGKGDWETLNRPQADSRGQSRALSPTGSAAGASSSRSRSTRMSSATARSSCSIPRGIRQAITACW